MFSWFFISSFSLYLFCFSFCGLMNISKMQNKIFFFFFVNLLCFWFVVTLFFMYTKPSLYLLALDYLVIYRLKNIVWKKAYIFWHFSPTFYVFNVLFYVFIFILLLFIVVMIAFTGFFFLICVSDLLSCASLL